MSGSSVVVPNAQLIGNYPPAIMSALVTVATQAKADLDAVIGGGGAGAAFKARAATTANITLSAAQTIDGVSVVAGDIVLVKAQSTASQNGLYTAATGAWTRVTNSDGTAVEKEGVVVSVAEGTANSDTIWQAGATVTTWTEIEAATATPAAVAATGAVGTSNLLARSDHAHADPLRAAAGANLTDAATQTVATPGISWRLLPTLSQNGALTIGTTSSVAGDVFKVIRTDTGSFKYDVINGGVGAGTLYTFPAGLQGNAEFQFDGTNWALKSSSFETQTANTLGQHQARYVMTSNVASLATFTVAQDGVTGVQGDRVLLVGQTSKAQNGIYVIGTVGGGTAPLTRPADFCAANVLPASAVCEVNAGTLFAQTTWKITTAGAITVDTTAHDWYPRFVAQSITLVAGTKNIANVPILSATKTTYSINRVTPNTSTLTTGGYHPAAAATPGVVGTASVDIQAEVAAGTINNADISTLLLGIHNW